MNIIPMKPKAPRPSAHDPAGARAGKVIAITSGKGGVGKTNVTSNLAVALAKQGRRVCIFDADTSLANINVIMGVTPRYTIEHLLNGERSIEEILLAGPQGVMIVPAASGIAELADLDAAGRARLIAALRVLEESFDYLLIDTAAGIGDSVLSFVQSAQHTILVISTEPTSLTDAFALLRVLKKQAYERPTYVLVNMAVNYANSMEVYKRFEAAVRKYLGMKVHYLGYITDDKAIKISIGRQRPVLLNDPDALASRCFTTLAAVLGKQFTAQAAPAHSFSAWWSELAGSLEGTTAATDAREADTRSHDSPGRDARVPDVSGAAPSDSGQVSRDIVVTGSAEAEASVQEPPRSAIPPADTHPDFRGPDLHSQEDQTSDRSADGKAADIRVEERPIETVPVSPAAPSPAVELRHLAERASALLSAPHVGAADFSRFLAPLFELYLDCFHRLPLPDAGGLARLLARTDYTEEELRSWTEALEKHFEQRFGVSLHEDRARRTAMQEQQDRLLAEYREVVARLEAEQARLDQTLARLYEHIETELSGSGRRSAGGGAWIDRAVDGEDAAIDRLPPVYRSDDPGPP